MVSWKESKKEKNSKILSEKFKKMFEIFINDGTKEMPTDDIFYIIAKEGIFLRKKYKK